MFKPKIDRARLERENKQRKDLKMILATAKGIIDRTSTFQGTHPIFLLIKQLVDLELNKNIYNSISTYDSNKVKFFTHYDLLPNSYEKYEGMRVPFINHEKDYLYEDSVGYRVTYNDFFNKSKIQGRTALIKLGFDPVLTRPWEPGRLVNTLTRIGKGKPNGDWCQDSNHSAELWLPFGITFVNSGNHSITTGILNREGQLDVTKIYDASKIFSHIYSDGVNYFRRDNTLLAPVENFSLAVVFEIGRLIAEKHIVFKELEPSNEAING